MPKKHLIFLSVLIIGCTGINEHRTTGTFIEDFSIERKVIKSIKKDYDLNEKSNINANSYNETLLLTGQVPTEKLRERAVKKAEKIKKVKKIHDYMEIAAPSSLIARSNDSYLTTKVKTKILAEALFKKEKNIQADRIKVVTENSTVFLMGIVSKEQSRVATKIARETMGVQRVVALWEIL